MKCQTSDTPQKDPLGNVRKGLDSLREQIDMLIAANTELMGRLECVTLPESPEKDETDSKIQEVTTTCDIASQLHDIELVLARETSRVRHQIIRLDI